MQENKRPVMIEGESVMELLMRYRGTVIINRGTLRISGGSTEEKESFILQQAHLLGKIEAVDELVALLFPPQESDTD